MAMSISPAWYKWACELERSHNGPIGAGLMAHHFEKFFEERTIDNERHVPSLNFYYFVHFSRRKLNLRVCELAQKADIEYDELMALEQDTQYKLKRASVIKLAKFFRVDENALVKMARLDEPHTDPTWDKVPAQFPERVDSTEELGEFERIAVMALEDFLMRQAQKEGVNCAIEAET